MLLKRTDSSDKDFIKLVRLLDDYIARINGDQIPFYAQFNKIDNIRNVVVAYEGEMAIGCGAFKFYEPSVAEIKRMYTLAEFRGRRIASFILKELEKWAAETGFEKCILETGIEFTDAVRLYTKNNYNRIPNFGQYDGVENSVCFEKSLLK